MAPLRVRCTGVSPATTVTRVPTALEVCTVPLFLGCWRTPLKHVERVALAAWRRSLAPEARALLRRQLAVRTAISRDLRGKCVSFGVGHTGVPKFPNTSEAHAARVVMKASVAGPIRLRCDIYCCAGYLFELIFSRPTADIQRIDLSSIHVDLYANLLEAEGEPTALSVRDMNRLADHFAIGPIDDARTPAPARRLDAFRRAWVDVLPHDYLQLCSWCDSITSGQWQFLGTTAYLVAFTEDINLLVLASGPNGLMLAVRVPATRDTVVELYEHDTPVPIGQWDGFVDAFRYVCSGLSGPNSAPAFRRG